MKLLHGMKDEALSYSNNIKLLTTKLDQRILYISNKNALTAASKSRLLGD